MRAEKTGLSAVEAIAVVLGHSVAAAGRESVAKGVARGGITGASGGPQARLKGAKSAATVREGNAEALATVAVVTSASNVNDANHRRRCPKSASLCFRMIRASNRSPARYE
jgi:hypothetical protein